MTHNDSDVCADGASDVAALPQSDVLCSAFHARSAHHLRSKHHARRTHHVPRKRNTSLKKASFVSRQKTLFSWLSPRKRTPEHRKSAQKASAYRLDKSEFIVLLSVYKSVPKPQVS